MDNPKRAAALAEYRILDTPPEKEFDDFTRLASQICGKPISLISLLDSGRQWFKSKLGIDVSETPIDQSFCIHAVKAGELFEVPNALKDERFNANPLVLGDPNIRFYAGTPLVTPDGVGIGSLCVIDSKPGHLSEEQKSALEVLGKQLMHLFELRRIAQRLKESENAVREFNENLERLVSKRGHELRESEERFLQLAENSSDVFWFVDLQPERILYVSPAVKTLWGRPPEYFYGTARAWLECLHPDDRVRIQEELDKAIAAEKTQFETEYRVVRPDGSVRWVLYRGTPIHDEGGKIVRVGGIAKDITERKEAAAALNDALEQLQLATKASGLGVWDFQFASGRVKWDEQMFKLYGVSPDANIAGLDRWRECLHPEDRSRALAVLEECMHSGEKPFDLEFRIIRPSDGEIRHFRSIATVFREKDGKPARMIGTTWDVTSDRQREQALALALSKQKELTESALAGERAKSEFLAVMSHEIRTPLNGILGFTDILSEMKDLPEEGRAHLETIANSGEALLRILNDVLDFSRMEAGQLQVERTTYSPAELISEIGDFFLPQANIQEIQLHTSVGKSVPPFVSGDPGRIRQILLNLAGNAFKFIKSGSISIGVRPSIASSTLEFFVEDTGPGIPPEKLDSIFKAFTQADSSHAREHGGTGLGLTISRKLARLMGGVLTVENLPQGGARFSLNLPMEVAAAPISASVSVETFLESPFALESSKMILVAEDDKVNLRLVLSMVRKLGYDPLVAKNGVEAFEVYKAMRPPCILMDVQMPEMDGIEATRQIRNFERNEGLPASFIIALTANILPEDQQRCFEAGMNFYLNKPFKKQAIDDALRKAPQFSFP